MKKTLKTTLPSRHPIRVVARRTGLSPSLLRAWERRYGVVEPGRSEGGQRFYTDEEVRRLILLKRSVEGGRSIGQVAQLTDGELEALVREDGGVQPLGGAPGGEGEGEPRELLARAWRAVEEMAPERLERILTRGAVALPAPAVMEEIVTPLLEEVGSAWRRGDLTPAQEHLASVVVRRFLEWLMASMVVEPGAPVLVAGTPGGEKHELGALLAAATGAAEGWRAIFLGPDLPPQEIAAATLRLGGRVVALSAVDRALGDALGSQLGDLRSRLPREVEVVVGGSAAVAGLGKAGVEGVRLLEGLGELRALLREVG